MTLIALKKEFIHGINQPQVQQVQVVPYGQTQLNTQSTDEDIQLAMALSASAAETNNQPPKPKKEDVQLEFEMTDHKPKIIRNQQPPSKQNGNMPQGMKRRESQDFLDLDSMNLEVNEDEEKQEVLVDDNDPFASLIRQYNKVFNILYMFRNSQFGTDFNLGSIPI